MTTTIYDSQMSDAGLALNHKLIHVQGNDFLPPPTSAVYVQVFRNIKAVDPLTFTDLLIDSGLFTAPANSANDFAEQMKTTVPMTLDKLAAIETCNRQPSKKYHEMAFIRGIADKEVTSSSRLERKRKSSGLEEDRLRLSPCNKQTY